MKLVEQKIDEKAELLKPEELRELAGQVPGWQASKADLVREFEFGSFREAMDFANDIADLAERERHHPDILISFKKVRVTLRTHKAGGVTRNDFILAARIDQLRS